MVSISTKVCNAILYLVVSISTKVCNAILYSVVSISTNIYSVVSISTKVYIQWLVLAPRFSGEQGLYFKMKLFDAYRAKFYAVGLC